MLNAFDGNQINWNNNYHNNPFWLAYANQQRDTRDRVIGVASVIAMLATAPFAAFHFHRLALYGLPANLVAVPLTAFWIMPWAVLAVLRNKRAIRRPAGFRDLAPAGPRIPELCGATSLCPPVSHVCGQPIATLAAGHARSARLPMGACPTLSKLLPFPVVLVPCG